MISKMVLQRHRRLVSFGLIIIIFMAFFTLKAYCAGDHSEEYPDVFVHDSIHINPEQNIEHLMVANGNATVAGKITEGIIVVDGDLTLQPEARVSGRVIVLGGNITIHEGAQLATQPKVVVPKGHPFVTIIILGLFVMCGAGLVLIPITLWLIGHFFTRTRWYDSLIRRIGGLERRWPAIYIALALSISALMLVGFSFLAWTTMFRHTADLIDQEFIWLIRYFHGPALDRIMIFISDLGEGLYFIVLILVSYGLLLYGKRWYEIAALTICLSGGGALVLLLKNLFQRTRPDLYRVIAETGYSFPSGHALLSLCFYGLVVFLIMRNISSWRGRLTIMTLAIILVIAIGISRIYLGVHYPTDVVAGYAAGSMWLAFCISLLMWWEREWAKNIR